MRRRFSTLQRWPLITHRVHRGAPGGLGALAPQSLRAHRVTVGIAAGVGAALGVGSTLPGLPLPFVLRIVLGLAGLASIAWAVFRKGPVVVASGTYVEASAAGLSRVTEGAPKPAAIVAWDAPFGLALLASYGRSTALLAFTTPTQTRYVPARIDDRTEADDELLARIAVLADLDFVDGVAHEAALTSAATASLVRHVQHRDAQALGRLFLSDGKGVPIALDRATLAIGTRSFDLTSRLEWRPLMFHESTGQAAALYQATWIRQAGSEVVLVAPMPASIVPREAGSRSESSGRLGRALMRDLRLLQANAEHPPARDVRVAIDRPFMLAIRRVLDDAPLAARVAPDPVPRPRSERRRTLP